MFGYVTPLKPELKIKDYTKFQGYYCGLCHGIKESYGNLPRMTLNYDMAFLSILLDSITDETTSFRQLRCPVHPFQKRAIVYNSKALEYASSINVVLFYYKLVDDTIDDKSLKSKAGTILLNKAKKSFSTNYEELHNTIKDNLNLLNQLENNKTFSSLDEISHPFAHLTGELLKSYPHISDKQSEGIRDRLYKLGYNLGKWIYVIDAFDDLEEDMKKDKFNPINYLFNEKNNTYEVLYTDIKPRIEFTLLNCSYSTFNAFEGLDVKKNYDLLHNILQLGMMHKNHTIINRCKNNCKSKKEKL